MAEIDDLFDAYGSHVAVPWKDNLSGAERVWFLVYSPQNERRLRQKMQELQLHTQDAGHEWHHVDLTDCFPRWLASQRHRDGLFKRPDGLPEQRFIKFACDEIRSVAAAASANDVIALSGVGSMFGITRLSGIIKAIEGDVKGRLLVCFPGVRDGSTYRMFETGDGWNYLAVPITAGRETRS